MKSFSFLIPLLLLVASVQAYTYRWRVPVVDNKCMTTEGPKEGNQPWFDDEKCERYSCDLQDRRVDAVGCGVISLPEGSDCRMVRDKGHYPDCCPKPVCSRTSAL